MTPRPARIALAACLTLAAAAGAQPSPDQRARDTEAQMTDDERFALVHGVIALPVNGPMPAPPGGLYGAGYVPGVPRLGIPALHETDVTLGVTNPSNLRTGDVATALPASLMLGATFDPSLARRSGAVIGAEARAHGFNVLLGGGMNLARDPRNGRNFEYVSEDPLLSGVIAAETVIGAQSAGVIGTVKHFALNANETNRSTVDAVIGEAALRESDLLAFEIAIERSQPGAVMCAYNRVNGDYSCGNDYLLNKVLKGAWGYKGWVMSDWGAVHDASYAVTGLDQQSGEQLDGQVWFDKPLAAELAAGRLPHARLSDMVRRILRSIYASGIARPAPAVDLAKHRRTALEVARAGIVLLKNDGVLPLAAGTRTIAVIGGRANVGVISGGGSSQVTPIGGYAATIPRGGEADGVAWSAETYAPSAPLEELRKLMPKAQLAFDPGLYPVAAAALAKRSDLAIVFVTKHEVEGFDSPDLSLPEGQDAVIAAVAAANPRTIVVLETGNPIAMPWKDGVKAIVAAFYPGQAGGQAIAEVLTGIVNPSGRLPITFPASVADTPRPELPGFGTPDGTPTRIDYSEGSDVGYRWFARTGRKPLYAFGHGLSYTRFSYAQLQATGGQTPTISFTVRNDGDRAGSDVPQVYLTSLAGVKTERLIGFQRVTLKPGETRRVTLVADPRLLASYDTALHRWRIAGGRYALALSRAADAPVLATEVTLAGRTFGQ